MSIRRLLGLLVVLGLIAGGALIVRAETSAPASVAGVDPAPSTGFDPQRTQDADAARWTAMAGAYAKEAERVQRVQDADAARWVAMGEFYANESLRIQRSQDADAARWTAMAEAYAKNAERIQRSQAADDARWAALAKFYMKLQASKR